MSVRHLLLPALIAAAAATATAARPAPAGPPIRHVVVVLQENHSFDNALGELCAVTLAGRCDGAVSGRLHTGQTVTLGHADDLVPAVSHNVPSQATAIDDGAMDGFDLIQECAGQSDGGPCYTQFDPSQIPNLAALASAFAVSDRTFEFAATPSWAGHLVFAAATKDGFQGNNPKGGGIGAAGWGCDSGATTQWWNGTRYLSVLPCVPDAQGRTGHGATPVAYVPTIFDRLDQAGLPWRIYGGLGGPGSGYGWAICPSFYECLGSAQRKNLVPARDVIADAASGSLPAFAIVTPTIANSQHNQNSMAQGDNWLGSVMGALMASPDWDNTAVFVTYDDCGCFYDHVPPPAGRGIRVPMVIVSPYARPASTDSTVADFTSILAFVEHTLGLQPLNSSDATAYDYSGSFDYAQPLLPPVAMRSSPIPAWERAWIRSHPASEDDPT